MRFVARRSGRGWQVFDCAAGTTCGRLYDTKKAAEEAAAIDERGHGWADLEYDLLREQDHALTDEHFQYYRLHSDE